MYPFRLEYWNQEDGVDNPFFVMRNGNRVFASNSGIKVLDPSRRRWEPWVDPGMVGTTVHLIPGPGDSIYAASLIRGVTQISRDGKLLARSNYGPGGARLAGDGHRHTWLAGTGITLVTKKRGRLELTPQGMGSGVSLDMEYDAKRNELWACQEREVVLFAENQWTHITSKDGLLDDHCRSIAVLPGAEVWVGYAHLDSLSRIRRNSSGTIQVDTFIDRWRGAVVASGRSQDRLAEAGGVLFHRPAFAAVG
jgi:hypothetical protein